MALLKKRMALLGLGLILSIVSGCGVGEDQEIVVAQQYGLAYAPLVIMQEKGFLEKAAGDAYNVRWETLGNTAAIREAMLSDRLDVGFMGIPPFLIGSDQGMDWKIISGLSASPLGLMTNDGAIESLDDLKDAGKIALPQPGSIQHILLAMAADQAYGDPKYFDQQLVSMKHPEGYQTLMTSKDVVAHFTSPPYLFYEMEEDQLELLMTGEEAFGGSFSFIIGACRRDFYEDEGAYRAFEEALSASIDYMETHRQESIAILSQSYELSEALTADYIYDSGLTYSGSVSGVQKFIDFMYQADYIKTDYKEEDLLW